jgi:hypothetical protein
MKLSTKFALFATILSLASPCANAVGSSNEQGKQLRGVGRNTMVVSEQELGKPQDEVRASTENELDEVLIEEFGEDDIQDDDDEEDLDDNQEDVDVLVEENDADQDDIDEEDLLISDDDDVEDDEDEDEADLDELQAFIEFVNAKEGVDSKQNTDAIIFEEEDEDEDDDDDDDFLEDGKGRALVGEEDKDSSGEQIKARVLGYHGGGKKCYWYHEYKRCYYRHKKHYKPYNYYH